MCEQPDDDDDVEVCVSTKWSLKMFEDGTISETSVQQVETF